MKYNPEIFLNAAQLVDSDKHRFACLAIRTQLEPEHVTAFKTLFGCQNQTFECPHIRVEFYENPMRGSLILADVVRKGRAEAKEMRVLALLLASAMAADGSLEQTVDEVSP